MEIVLVTLRETPQAEFLLKSKKFQTVDEILAALVPAMTFAALAHAKRPAEFADIWNKFVLTIVLCLLGHPFSPI